ncbi:MAG: hypothetical protein ACI4F8_10230 [Lachnospiraceae bacterium]
MGKELIEFLLILDGLLFSWGFGFGQYHGCADGKAKDRTHIGASLFCLDALMAFFGIFAVIGNQPTSRCQTAQTSTESSIDATDVVMRSFFSFLSTSEATASISSASSTAGGRRMFTIRMSCMPCSRPLTRRFFLDYDLLSGKKTGT